MNLQWTGGEPAPTRNPVGRTTYRSRAIVRPVDDLDRAVERMLVDARGKCGVARGGRWTRDNVSVPGRDAQGTPAFGPGRAGIHTDVRHRRPSRVA